MDQVRPASSVLASTIAAGVGAVAVFALLRRRPPAVPPRGMVRAGAYNALAAMQRANFRKEWVDQWVAPLVGLLVVLGAAAGALAETRAAIRKVSPTTSE